MGGFEFAALGSLLGLTSAIAVVGAIFGAWMAWRIVEKAGLPGWVGLGAVLITLTGVGSIVPLILLWVFAFMRWPRDEGRMAVTYAPGQPQPNAAPNAQLAAPRAALPSPAPAARGWQLSGGGHTLIFNATSTGPSPAVRSSGRAISACPTPRSASLTPACWWRASGSAWKISARPAAP